mmetsp:Transcript_7112/g.8609  ORF Transcript_7112/g.8609 Transcript_7112/m.8609 type:complete len:370 (-) Transcript_7112:1111-2220(-)
MGNQNKKFEGKGHVLGGQSSGAPSPPNKGRYGNKEKVQGKIVRKVTRKPKKVVLTEEQRQAQRAQQAAAAEKRGNAWDDRIQKNRARRNQQKESENAGFDASRGTAQGSASIGIDKKLQAKLDNDAKELAKSGFNPYEASFATSENARAAINLGNADCSYVADEFVKHENPGNSENEHVTKIGLLLSELHDAIEQCDAEALKKAVTNAVAFSKFDEQGLMQNDLDRAQNLLAILQNGSSESVPVVTPDAVQKVTRTLHMLCDNNLVDTDTARTALTTTKKILQNILTSPQEEKFRKIRLSNKTIESKLVIPAGGEALNLLRVCGFQDQIMEEEGTKQSFMVLEKSETETLIKRAEVIVMYIDDSLSSLS